MQNSEQGRARKRRFQERLHVLHDTALHRKLKEHLPAAFNDRWTRRHWIHASLFATISAMVRGQSTSSPSSAKACSIAWRPLS